MAPPDPRSDGDDASSSASGAPSLYSSDDEEESPIIRSQAGLLYNLSSLSEKTATFIKESCCEPSRIALEKCRDIDGTYAFQMTELVSRSVRITQTDEGSSRLSCSCKHGQEDGETCYHMVWLLDQLAEQMLYEDRSKDLEATEIGFPKELGDPHKAISTHGLYMVSTGLHCRSISRPVNKVDATRTLEARELLASVYNEKPEDFRPQLSTTATKKVIKRHDLQQTIFRMLVDESHFFNYFLSKTRSSDAINDPFRKLRQRVDLVLQHLDNPDEKNATIPWASHHILGCITQIRSDIFSRTSPLSPHEASSAASTLVHILTCVLARHTPAPRSLYHHLIGDKDHDFIVSTLELIPEAASAFLHTLEELVDRMSVHGVPASYVDKFRTLFGRLRKSRTGAGAKRQSQEGGERRAKRMR